MYILRICAAFCCSEEKWEEAKGGNSNWKLNKEWVVSSGSINNAGGVSEDWGEVFVFNGLGSDSLVDANLGGVWESGIDGSHNISAAIEGVLRGADRVISGAAKTCGIEGGVLSAGESNNECECNNDGSSFHIMILFAVN